MRPPKGLSQKWSLGEVVVIVVTSAITPPPPPPPTAKVVLPKAEERIYEGENDGIKLDSWRLEEHYVCGAWINVIKKRKGGPVDAEIRDMESRLLLASFDFWFFDIFILHIKIKLYVLTIQWY